MIQRIMIPPSTQNVHSTNHISKATTHSTSYSMTISNVTWSKPTSISNKYFTSPAPHHGLSWPWRSISPTTISTPIQYLYSDIKRPGDTWHERSTLNNFTRIHPTWTNITQHFIRDIFIHCIIIAVTKSFSITSIPKLEKLHNKRPMLLSDDLEVFIMIHISKHPSNYPESPSTTKHTLPIVSALPINNYTHLHEHHWPHLYRHPSGYTTQNNTHTPTSVANHQFITVKELPTT